MVEQQDAVGLALYAEKINKFLPPKATKTYLLEIYKQLSAINPSDKTHTASALNSIAEKIKRRGLVIIVSDFFDDINSILKSLKHFRYKNNEVIVFQILDPLERSFAFGRDAIFRDIETLDELNYRSLSWGFPLLTLGILSGAVWAEYAWGHFWLWEPRLVLSVLTWVLYALLLYYRTAGWQGRRAAALTIICFAVLLVSFLGVRLLPGRHGGQFG
jgi:ABC-type transport system involved in cytochrome c biogenesis permease subunit